ncbi:hypothetical protein CC1G_08077 [Coprinopsis cinerea okayama7|uniref:F-box domain-containing protein n=1 Tax=Coprinopsis cinerea (strain Okayama-7 / 130 / ATCC MYA-4618 / FGSC 9003) TaxID=240176 RepID=A8NVN6_COPC7|nr:hypothetical protein CC1G_08077 [Coprinopsis cinerea okayama7\|eukprot:XP_001836692.1 hypothetical protein CC1G_08077 [Coprinopsis cinerea okayama7\
MFWEPTTILQHGAGECLATWGGKPRPLSLQLKPLSFVNCANLSYALKSPFHTATFDISTFSRTLASPSPHSPPPSTELAVEPTSTQTARVHTENPVVEPSIINSLPTEILCLIFEEYLISPTDENGDVEMDGETPIPTVSSDFVNSPLTLSHVCKHWRSTAIAHKKLWSTIAVSIKPHCENAAVRGKNLVRLLRLFLSRANGTSLKISVASHRDSDVMSHHEVGLAYTVVQICLAHASRWRSLRLQLPSEELQRALVRSLEERREVFSELRELMLDVGCEWEDEEESGVHPGALIYDAIFRASPNLSNLVIDDDLLAFLESPNHNLDAVIPWSHLKSIEVACTAIPARRLLDICEKATNVEKLSVWRVSEEDEESQVEGGDVRQGRGLVSMPKLSQAKVALLSHPRGLLSSLALPSLRNLELDVQGLGYSWSSARSPVSSLDDFVKPLETLLDNSNASSLHSIRYRVKQQCLASGDGQVVDQQWCREKGLKRLACVEVLEVEIYKF